MGGKVHEEPLMGESGRAVASLPVLTVDADKLRDILERLTRARWEAGDPVGSVGEGGDDGYIHHNAKLSRDRCLSTSHNSCMRFRLGVVRLDLLVTLSTIGFAEKHRGFVRAPAVMGTRTVAA